MTYLRFVLQTLKYRQLIIKFNKCEFWLQSVSFLGHVVSTKRIRVDSQKIEVVQHWPILIFSNNISCFFGLSIYYERFIEGFSSIASVLMKLTQSKIKFKLSDECEKSFLKLKTRLTTTHVLTLRFRLLHGPL